MGGYEFRYVCPRCETEYIHDTLNRSVLEVPEGADFRIRLVEGEEIIQVNPPYILRLWGLPPEKSGIELKAEEVRKLAKRARRIQDRLSDRFIDDEFLVWERFRLSPKETRKLLGRDI
jgi:hypothetical protein